MGCGVTGYLYPVFGGETIRESEPIERIFRSRFCTRTTRVRSGERPDLGDDGAGPVSGVGLAAGSVKKKKERKERKPSVLVHVHVQGKKKKRGSIRSCTSQ